MGFWGVVSDKLKKKKFIFALTKVLSIAALALLAFPAIARDFYMILLISCGTQLFASGGILDAYCFDVLGDHVKTHYGGIRMFLALSWGGGCFAMSWITDKYGINYNFILFVGMGLLSL